ncbi:MAG TPA: hypothetical protein DCS89_11865 [Gammaproteobacteria bacterium]|nr:hypothetical protein [Gammaproteobacteria bacterium]HAT27706.1 hypothetical protein [Gammaproteobacteria bacterium]HIF85954.1 hypothetical protein [Gammaproteobacteria bacterium]HIL64072.1 hypothetical protein [Porticoccaceae bacterium]
MIFSLLNVRKKTAASIAGIFIGLACLWGVSIWQDISPQEMVNILIGTVIMLAVIIGGALLLIIIFKLLCGLLRRLGASKENDA